MFSYFQTSLYRKLLLAFLLIGVIPSSVGFYLAYLGTREVIESHAGLQFSTQVERYSARADERINQLGQSCQALFDNSVLQLLARRIKDDPAHARQSGGPAGSDETLQDKFKIALQGLLREHANLAEFPLMVVHRAAPAPVYVSSVEQQAALQGLIQRHAALLEGRLRGDLFDSLNTDTGEPQIGYCYGIDGETLANSELIFFLLLQPGKLFPFLQSSQLAEDLGFAILSKSGHVLFESGTFRLPRSPAYRNQILTALQLSGLTESEQLPDLEPADPPNLLIAHHQLLALRRKVNGLELDADWIFCLIGDTTAMESNLGWLYWRVWLLNGALLLVITAVCWGLARRLVMPLLELTRAAQLISRGNLGSRVPVFSQDEIGSLARSFNEMAGQLDQSYRELKKSLAEVGQQAQQLALLQDITNAMNTELEIEKMLAMTLLEVKKIIPHDIASVSFYNAAQHTVTVQLTIPDVDEFLFRKGQTYPVQNSNRGSVIESKQPLLKEIGDGEQGHSAEDDPLRRIGVRSILVLPLISRGEVIGTLGIGSRTPHSLGPAQSQVMLRLANSLAVMITHNRLYKQVLSFAEELEQKVEERTQQLADAQSQLILAEKYAATGRLSGTVAHEINNPLGIIKNYLGIVMSQVASAGGGRRRTDPNMEHLTIIQEELDRIARIVKSLMDFYRPTPQKNVPTDLQLVCDQILALLLANWEKKGISVDTQYVEQLPLTCVSPDFMRQVFMNLLRNAEDAMEDGGQVTIRFSVEPELRKDRDGEVIRIDIGDTGCGIPPEIQARVFEPFYTTKKEGKGTGLGLSVTYGIMQALDGAMELHSEPGEGTTISLIIPIHRVTGDVEDPTQPGPIFLS